MLREQFFALLLDRDAALAAIPKMLPAGSSVRAEILGQVHQVVSAVGSRAASRPNGWRRSRSCSAAGPAAGPGRKAVGRKPAPARKAAGVRTRKKVA
ncbi:MAG: hypothetical protein IPO75_19345 [Betaproteobacteria bacterium]|nr:hypothetical protein [Betaproteobacteria bacterium]